MNLKSFTDDELQQELGRRQAKIKKESKPKPLDNINWDDVIAHANDIISDIDNGSYHEDNDDTQYMYEGVMTAVFGKDIFDWINKNT